jgi:MFS family permease
MNLVTAFISGLGHGFYTNGIGILFKPIAAELNMTRAATSWATGVGRLQGGLESPLTGWLCDRFGPKWVMIVGVFIVSVGLALMNVITSTWAYIVVWGFIIGVGINLALTIAADKAMANWFISKRGLAFGVRFAIIGACGALVVPIVERLVAAKDWRTACLVWSVVMLASIPLLWAFVRQKRPEYYGLLPDGAAVGPDSEVDLDSMIDLGVEYATGLDEVEFTLRQAMKTRSYWMFVIAWVCASVVLGGINIHVYNFLTDMGIDSTVASGMLAMMVFFTVPGRFFGGFLADHVRKDRQNYLVAGAFLLQAIGIIAYLLHQNVTMAYVFLVLYGLGSGAPTPLRLALVGRYFGRKAFASIQGSAMMFSAPVGLLAPVFSGWIYDTTGSYTNAFILYVGLVILAAFLMCLVQPPRPPSVVGDIRKFM